MGKHTRRHAERIWATAHAADPLRHSEAAPDIATISKLLAEAVVARTTNNGRRVDVLIDRLAYLPVSLHGQDDVSTALVQALSQQLRGLWRRGWQPIDVVCVIRRLQSPAHAELVAAAVALDANHDRDLAIHEQWGAQLEALGAWWEQRNEPHGTWLDRIANASALSRHSAIEHAIDVLSRISSLHELATLIPPPGPGASAGLEGHRTRQHEPLDAKILTRVRALLAKAESTDFADEADSFTQKAQELMTRHSIDVAMLHAISGGAHQPVQGRRVHLDPPYVDAKASIAGAVGGANRCRVVLDGAYGLITVFGFDTDLDVFEVLFTSLLAQATIALVAASRAASIANDGARTKSFRQSFLLSYADRIGRRLREADTASTNLAEETFGTALVPVLAQRKQAVDDALRAAFPKTTQRNRRISNEAGWHAGRIAADQASLTPWAAVRS